MAEIDWNLLSIEDLRAYTEKRYDDMSVDSLRYVTGEGFDTGEALMSGLGRGFSSGLRGIVGAMIPENDFISIDREADVEQERKQRMMQETNPLAAYGGLVLGSIFDPINLPAGILSGVKSLAGKGAAAGGFGGLIEPTYEEFGEGLAQTGINIAAGAGVGAGIGVIASKLLSKFGIKADSPTAAKEAEQAGEEAQQLLEEFNNNKQGIKDFEEFKAVETEEPAFPVGKDLQFNPETKGMETVEMVAPQVDFSLPRALSGAKPRMGSVTPKFDSDIDRALYIVAKPTRSQSHDLYMDWLKSVTGLDEKQVKILGNSSYKDTIKLAVSAKSDTVNIPTSKFASDIMAARSTPQRVVTPAAPQRVVKRTKLYPKDIDLLKNAGLEVMESIDGRVKFRDLTQPRKPFVNAVVADERMKAVGIDLDLPAYKQLVKDAKRAQAEIGPRQRELPLDPETPMATGAPKEGRSVGSAAARPAQVYGGDLGASKFHEMPATEILNRSLSFDDVRKIVPEADVGRLGTRLNDYIKEGQDKLRRIIRQHGDIVNWMTKRGRDARPLSEDEVNALMPFYWTIKQARRDLLASKLADRKAGVVMSDAEAQKFVEDMAYYTGIELFKKNAGNKASRALGAFKLISTNNSLGKEMQQMFSGVVC